MGRAMQDGCLQGVHEFSSKVVCLHYHQLEAFAKTELILRSDIYLASKRNIGIVSVCLSRFRTKFHLINLQNP